MQVRCRAGLAPVDSSGWPRDGAHKKDLVDALAGAGIDIRSAARDTSTQLRQALGTLLRRAQATGAVRRHVTIDEIFALLGATLTAAARAQTSPARLFAIVCDGLRTT